jgi:hypothetical protein
MNNERDSRGLFQNTILLFTKSAIIPDTCTIFVLGTARLLPSNQHVQLVCYIFKNYEQYYYTFSGKAKPK